jgi:putative alpha-1,2-mannosidase
VPLVSSARIHLPQGRVLTIVPAASGGARLDGQPLPRTAMPHAALAGGGLLRLGPP